MEQQLYSFGLYPVIRITDVSCTFKGYLDV